MTFQAPREGDLRRGGHARAAHLDVGTAGRGEDPAQNKAAMRCIAAALTCAPGRDIAFAGVTPEAFAASLRGLLPPGQPDRLPEDDAHCRRGEAAQMTTVAGLTGQPPGTSASSPATTAAFTG